MRYWFLLIVISFCFEYFASAQSIERKSLSVTVYNNNLGVVKDTRIMSIPKGISEIKLKDVSMAIDPTSVHIDLNGHVLEQNYQYDLASMHKILQKYLDREISLIDSKGTQITGTLISGSSNQIVLRKADGGLVMLPNIDDYKVSVGDLPDGLITVPTLVWIVDSKTDGRQDVEVSYQTHSMDWHAEYIAVLNDDDTKMDFNSWVSITNNSGTKYPNAKLKLVAGDVNLVQNDDYFIEKRRAYGVDVSPAAPQFEEKSFFEYHIYNLQRPTTLANNETKQISLFEASDVRVNKEYLYTSNLFGGYEVRKGKVSVVIKFKNMKKNNLGMPMPKGKVRLYKNDGESLEFIGEDRIDHTPKGEEIKLKVGDAFDIAVEDRMIDEKKISKKVREYEYEIKVRNHKEKNVEVNIEKILYGDWEILNSSFSYEKSNAQKVVFKVKVGKDDETILKFRVRIKS